MSSTLRNFSKRELIIKSLSGTSFDVAMVVRAVLKNRIVFCDRFYYYDREICLWRPDDNILLLLISVDVLEEYCTEINATTIETQKQALVDITHKLRDITFKRKVITELKPLMSDRDFPEKLDRLKGILPITDNRVIDLRTGQTRQRCYDDYFTYELNVDYLGREYQTEMGKFVEDIMSDESERAEFLQQALGYGVTGEKNIDMFMVLIGVGGNGKSIFLNQINKTFGNLVATMIECDLSCNNNKSSEFYAGMIGKRYAICSETSENLVIKESVIRTISSIDQVKAKLLYKDTFAISPLVLPIIACNDPPKLSFCDSILRRARYVEFKNNYVSAEALRKREEKGLSMTYHKLQDTNIEQRFSSNDTFTWVVQGAVKYYSNLRNITVPPSVVAFSSEVLEIDEDINEKIVMQFFVPDKNTFMKRKEITEILSTKLGTKITAQTVTKIFQKLNWSILKRHGYTGYLVKEIPSCSLIKTESQDYSVLEMTIYVLQLEHGKYYVGKTSCISSRVLQHFAGKGSEWTRIHKPIKVIETHTDDDMFAEEKHTLIAIDKYGIDNVRGGSLTKVKLSEAERKRTYEQIHSIKDECYKCGKKGHFAKECRTKNNDVIVENQQTNGLISCANMHAALRSELFGDTQIVVGIINCSFSIMLSICKEHKIQCPQLEEYFKEPESVINSLGITDKDIARYNRKKCTDWTRKDMGEKILTMLLYGSSTDSIEKELFLQWILFKQETKKLRDELARLRKEVPKLDKFKEMVTAYENDPKSKNAHDGSLIKIILQDIEAKIVWEAIEFFQSHKLEVTAYIYDDFQVRCAKEDRETRKKVQDLLDELNMRLPVKFIIKPWKTPLSELKFENEIELFEFTTSKVNPCLPKTTLIHETDAYMVVNCLPNFTHEEKCDIVNNQIFNVGDLVKKSNISRENKEKCLKCAKYVYDKFILLGIEPYNGHVIFYDDKRGYEIRIDNKGSITFIKCFQLSDMEKMIQIKMTEKD